MHEMRVRGAGVAMTPRQLARALKRLGLSQAQAAKRLGVEHSTVYRWLAGERKIPGPVEAAIKCWLGSSTPQGAK
jgi:transcriptional regulator with XRE-family HTH domain